MLFSGVVHPIDVLSLLIAVVVSLVLHELAHGYVALWNGDSTAKYQNRLTINPVAHFDLLGFMMLMFVGFGYAKPVPVNPFNFKKQRQGIFTVAIAGVTVNFILAFISSFCLALVAAFAVGEWAIFVYNFFYIMMFLNLSLIFFNLLPIFPLDGFRVVEAFTRHTNPYAKFMRDYGQYVLLGLICLSIFVDRMRMPYFFDLLGMYIQTMVGGVAWLFGALWGLFL